MKNRTENFLKVSILVLGTICSGVVFSTHDSIDTVTTVENATILEIRTETSNAIISYSADIIPVSDCDEGQTPHVIIDWNTNTNKKVMYSALITAHTLKKSVRIGLSGCKRGFPKAKFVDILE